MKKQTKIKQVIIFEKEQIIGLDNSWNKIQLSLSDKKNLHKVIKIELVILTQELKFISVV